MAIYCKNCGFVQHKDSVSIEVSRCEICHKRLAPPQADTETILTNGLTAHLKREGYPDKVVCPPPVCVWKVDSDGVWHTACGHAFQFEQAGPTENQAAFCLYCGRKLREGKD